MIGSVKARTLEDDANRGVDLLQGVLSAFRALGQGIVSKFLGLVELDATTSAPIGIYRHTYTSVSLSNNLAHYSLIKGHGQEG